jgi:hypothetical protein
LERLLRLLIDSFTDEEKVSGQDNEGEEEVKVESVEEEIRARLEVLLLKSLRGHDQNEIRGLNNGEWVLLLASGCRFNESSAESNRVHLNLLLSIDPLPR